jgi:hypothetical protein
MTPFRKTGKWLRSVLQGYYHTMAAAESAIGLAILVVLFRNRNTINIDDSRYHEGLTTMGMVYLGVVLAPLIGAVIAGVFGKAIGRVNAHRVTITGVGSPFS